MPEKFILEIFRKGAENLTIISNNCRVDDWDWGFELTGLIKGEELF